MTTSKHHYFSHRLLAVMVMAAIGMIATCIYAFWIIKLKPGLLTKRVRYHQMKHLEQGVMKFDERFGRLPTNLTEIVSAGLLPESSADYACAIRYDTFHPPAISFQSSDYIIQCFGEDAVITVREDVLGMLSRTWPYSRASRDRWSTTVVSGQREATPPPN